MIKILFVLEKGKNLCYGAETSLKEYLKEFSKDEEIEIDLLVKKSILTSKKEIKKNVKKFMKEVKIKNIFIMSLPVKTDDYEKKEIRDIISELVNEFFWIFNKKRYEKILERNKYDLIHINSSSLYKAIKGNENCILHIRTGIKKETIKSIMEYLKKAKGMIFIDQYTFQPFSDFDYAKKIILNNPIDGYKSLNINLETRKQYMKKFNLKKEDIVISLIGRISEDKGTEYLINEFNDSLRKDIVFLIIGNANTSKRMYEEKCKKIAQKNNRIIFTGVILDIEYIYSIHKYVMCYYLIH